MDIRVAPAGLNLSRPTGGSGVYFWSQAFNRAQTAARSQRLIVSFAAIAVPGSAAVVPQTGARPCGGHDGDLYGANQAACARWLITSRGVPKALAGQYRSRCVSRARNI